MTDAGYRVIVPSVLLSWVAPLLDIKAESFHQFLAICDHHRTTIRVGVKRNVVEPKAPIEVVQECTTHGQSHAIVAHGVIECDRSLLGGAQVWIWNKLNLKMLIPVAVCLRICTRRTRLTSRAAP